MQSSIAQAAAATKRVVHQFAAAERGATAVEYALIAVLLAVPLLLTAAALRDGLIGLLTSVTDAFAVIVG